MLNFTISWVWNGVRCGAMARFAATVLCGLSLAACAAATSTLSGLPKEMGGLPEGTPVRPASQLDYPAVHDMPPPRSTAVLTPEQVKATEAELTAVRDRQPNDAAPKKDRKKQQN